MKEICSSKMEEPVPNQKGVLNKVLINIVKFTLLVVTLLFALFCVIYFQANENFRTSILFFYLAIGCVVFLITTYNVMRGRLLEKYSVKRMRNLWKYAIVKIVISLGIILISTIGGLLSNADPAEAYNRYYINNIPGSLGLFWSIVFFFDVKSYIKQLSEAQGDATVFQNVV